MAKRSFVCSGQLQNIADTLTRELQNNALSCELVDSVYRPGLAVLVFEKYFWRASNRVSLTVVASEKDGQVAVDAIGSGGGQGPIFKMSWGAEEDFTYTVQEILQNYGFC